MKLSVLDQSPKRRGGTDADAIRETLLLAEAVDRLGYTRYWLAEHHNSGGLAGSAPEILIGQVAARTRNLRVGSGGVMLMHYSPLKVAEIFRMLETLFPGRIDLGVGRAPGSDGRTAHALAPTGIVDVQQFPHQIGDLTAYLRNSLPEGHPYQGVRAVPEGPTMPELWMLGSTETGAAYAAAFGWAFSFAHFISPEGGEQVIRKYKAGFRPSSHLKQPSASIGVSVTCAETDAEAERLAWSRWGSRVMNQRGERRGVPSPEEAMAYPYTPSDRVYLEHMRANSVWGSPARVKARLEELAAIYDVNEIVAVTITYDFAARVRSYELLAEAFGLAPRPEAATAEAGD